MRVHVLQISDISLVDYIALKNKAVYLPHTAGRWQKKRFRKAQCPIVERCVRVYADGCRSALGMVAGTKC